MNGMYEELIEKLRKNNRMSGWTHIDRLIDEAAEAIEALQQENEQLRAQVARMRGMLFELNEIAKDYAPWGNRYNGKGIGDIIQNADKLLDANTAQAYHNPADVDKCYSCNLSMQVEELSLLLKEKGEALRKAREVLYNLRMDDYPGFSAICEALAEIDAVGGKEE